MNPRFTFVRNPYDRAVSLHYHMRHHRHFPMFDETTSFTTFLESVAAADLSPGAYENEGLSLTSPQLMWFEATGRVDYVGRTERLREDLDELCDLLGVRRVAIPMVNRNPKRVERDYRDAYDEHTRRLVEQIYGADIDRFGYEF